MHYFQQALYHQVSKCPIVQFRMSKSRGWTTTECCWVPPKITLSRLWHRHICDPHLSLSHIVYIHRFIVHIPQSYFPSFHKLETSLCENIISLYRKQISFTNFWLCSDISPQNEGIVSNIALDSGCKY